MAAAWRLETRNAQLASCFEFSPNAGVMPAYGDEMVSVKFTPDAPMDLLAAIGLVIGGGPMQLVEATADVQTPEACLQESQSGKAEKASHWSARHGAF